MKRIWIKTDGTKYELPIAVADTAEQLAKMCGVHKNTVMSAVCHARAGRQKSVYHCIVIDD